MGAGMNDRIDLATRPDIRDALADIMREAMLHLRCNMPVLPPTDAAIVAETVGEALHNVPQFLGSRSGGSGFSPSYFLHSMNDLDVGMGRCTPAGRNTLEALKHSIERHMRLCGFSRD